MRDHRGGAGRDRLSRYKGLGLYRGGAPSALPAELAELAAKIDYAAVEVEGETVALPAGMEIDLGAVAKGYAGDVLAETARANDISSALLDLGQSTIVAVGGKPGGKPWRVGIVDPARPGSYFAVVELADMAMGTSGATSGTLNRTGFGTGTSWTRTPPPPPGAVSAR